VHNDADHPLSLYAASKRANELMAHNYSALFRVPTTGLRFFTVYGPWGRPDMALFMFTRNILEGRPIEVIKECLGRKAQKILLPLQPGDVPDTYADIDDLVRDVGYRPATSIEVGVRNFVDWFCEYYGYKH